LIHYWFDSRGLERPIDGRQRRARLEDKQVATPLYKQLAEQAVQLVEAGHSNLAIAKQLKTCDVTVAKAIAWWYRSRDLPVPKASDRRDQILARAKVMYEQGALLKDIATEFGYSPRGLKLALEAYFDKFGQVMPDGRSRRGNAATGAKANGHLAKDNPSSTTQA